MSALSIKRLEFEKGVYDSPATIKRKRKEKMELSKTTILEDKRLQDQIKKSIKRFDNNGKEESKLE